jgi:hypothetical protein
MVNDNHIRAMANAYGRTGMKILLSCEETGVQYLGIHGNMNQKWNYCWLFDARSFDHFMQMTVKVPRPPQMTHYITEILIPVTIPDEHPSLGKTV